MRPRRRRGRILSFSCFLSMPADERPRVARKSGVKNKVGKKKHCEKRKKRSKAKVGRKKLNFAKKY